MLNLRLAWIGIVTMVALVIQSWLADSSAQAQLVIRGGFGGAADDLPGQPNPEEPEFTERIRLPTDRSAERKIEEVVRLVNERQWSEAAQLLQIILDEPEDKFFKDERGRWVSVRSEANRILSTMPKDGVQFYEQKVGNDAKKALEAARKAGDPALLADVALRYMHTNAGAEAATLLGTHHLDQGRYVVAALCFERLMQREGQLDKFNALMLFKALVAFERAGDKTNSEKIWPTFVRKMSDGSLPLPLARMNPQQLRQLTVVEDLFRPRDRYDWPMFGGDQFRTAVSEGGAPFLDPRWVKETTSAVTKPHIDRAFASPATRARAQLAGYHPIAVGGLMIYRSYKALHAVNIKTGEEEWWFDSAVGLEQCARSRSGLDPTGQMEVWMQQFGSHALTAGVFYDNSLLGTLSTDNERVYLIEDIAVPPHPMFLQQLRWQPHFNLGRDLMPWMSRNQLKAYDIEKGKLAWVIGGEGGDGDPFNDTFFLGAPLPVGDKLYVLVEVNAQLQLLCLHPYKEKKGDSFEHKVTLHWRHILCDVEKRLLEDPIRRTQACHLAYSDGIMICPTNCGAVIAVDLLTRTTVWAKGYGEAAAEPIGGGRFPGKNPGYVGPGNPITWSSAAPMIRDGKVVFTAPDGKALYCLSLRNGDHLWSIAKTDNDLYLAGLFGKVALVVGKETCRAIDLDTGKETWSVSIEGPPSGRGVAASTDEGNIYYVPLKKGAVFAINLESRATFISRSPKGEVPGNLIFHDGDVLSQGIYHVLAYPQLKVKEKQMNQALAQNPKDPFGLTERGELRLYQGKLEEALEDLTAAMANKPDEAVARKARNKLYETLAGLLERHFTRYEPRIPELEQLIAIPAAPNEKPEDKLRRAEEERDRWARFHRMVAKGKEDQAFDKTDPKPEKLVEAFQAYLKFAGLGHSELIPIPEEPGTRVLPELWAQGRIHAMLVRANEEQKKVIEDSLRQEWEKAEKAGSVEALRAFVSLFGPVSEQGQKAKLLLAEKLIAANELLEAENKLWSLYQADHERKSLIAAQALDALARLYTRQGDLENATYYFGLLSKSYPKMVVRDGKTGDELFQELAMDKRFLAFLEGGSGVGGWVISDKITVEQSVGNFQQQQFLWLVPQGEIPPSYRKYRLGMNMNTYPNVMARLVDRSTGKIEKEFPMQGLRPNINFWDPRSHTPINLHFVGRTMVFQWGHWVYGIDPVQTKELWRYNTLGQLNPNANGQLGPNMYVYIQVQPNGVQELWYQDGSRERIGHLVMADANCACFLVKDEGLAAVDPSTGQKRWVKSDIAVGTELFGDGEYLFMLPAEGGKPQIIRTLDGSQVPIEDFTKLYQKRVKILGRNILVRETVDKAVVLRLYDIIAGADVWKKELGSDAVLLNCLTPTLAGAIDAKGKVTVFRLDSGKEVLAAAVDPANMDPNSRPQDVHLLEDGQHFYVVFNQTQKNDGKNRVIQPHGLLVRNVMVNGYIYAFDRTTGKEKWKREVPAQQLAVDQFDDNPLMVFASWVQQFENQGNPPIPVARRQATSVMAIDKRNGAVVHEEARADRGLQQFHTLRLDPKNSVVELQTYNYKVVFKLNPEGKSSGAVAPAPQPMDPIRPPRRPRPIEPGFDIPGGQVEIDPAELRKIVDEIVRNQDGIDLKKMEELRRIREALEKQKEKEKEKNK